MNEGSLGGVLLLDKPPGISSFQALRPVKRLFPKTKIGHAGTLDPAASGLLLIGIGSGTRLLEYLEGMSKTYSFEARFGFVSDSYDMEGAVEPYPPAPGAAPLDADAIGKALGSFRGRIRQTPPNYSAIKIDGERACDRMRAGETVTLESREVTVHSLELKSFADTADADSPATAANAQSAALEMTCSKGTYVRSLVHDLGAMLGRGAVTDKIRRLAIGPFRVEDALSPEDLAPGLSLLPLESAVTHLPAAVVVPEWIGRFLNGQASPITEQIHPVGPNRSMDEAYSPDQGYPTDQEYRALDGSGRLLAIATISPQGLLCPRKVLARA